MHKDKTPGEEIQTSELFAPMERQPEWIARPKIESLPLNELTSVNFEKLVARLADPPRGVPLQAFRYGKSGSTQGGIDVICIDAAAQKCDCYEGKRVVQIRAGQLRSWVDRFLSGDHVKDARSFTLCTTCPVSESTSLMQEWKECAFLLGRHGIAANLWDPDKVLHLLRQRPDIVSELFGDEVARNYCTPNDPKPGLPQSRVFAEQRVSVYGRMASIQNVSISCELSLPCRESLSTGAILSFARPDLSGVSIALTQKEIVQWMQWRAHATSNTSRPYAMGLHDDSKRHVLAANTARLILRAEELEHLDWIFDRAWHEFRKAADEVFSFLRCLRFKRLGDRDTFGLVSVQRGLWQLMLDFANEFDVAKGNSPWHIFDGAPGCLKVFTDSNGDRFDRGYHAILYAHNDCGIWMPWERKVQIGWTSPTDIAGQPSDLSPRKGWDAQYTHDWLLQEFIPEVLRWEAEKRRGTLPRKSFWTTQRQDEPRPIDMGDVAYSRASPLRWKAIPDDDVRELIDCVRALQCHATARSSSVEIEPALLAGALLSIDRVLPFAHPLDEHYIRGKLDLLPDEEIGAGIRRLATECTRSYYYASLDFQLRSLMAVLETVRDMPLGELAMVSRQLQLILDRCHEDVICDFFCA
jgi:hypothetical protein